MPYARMRVPRASNKKIIIFLFLKMGGSSFTFCLISSLSLSLMNIIDIDMYLIIKNKDSIITCLLDAS